MAHLFRYVHSLEMDHHQPKHEGNTDRAARQIGEIAGDLRHRRGGDRGAVFFFTLSVGRDNPR
jgi:hypothetical protein